MKLSKYEVYTFRFQARTNKNPYDISLEAEFRGPDGITLRIPGFYDDEETWLIRFAPTKVGTWTFETESDLAALDKIQGEEIRCVAEQPSPFHGPLRVDGQHPHHFIHDDGTRCLPLGDECDWLFALEMPEARRYLDRLTAYGFNQVLMQVYAHSCDWSVGQPKRLVPPPRYPWLGDNAHPEQTRMNPTFWRHLDGIIGYMHQKGILAHLMIQVHNKNVKWPEPGSDNDDRYWRHVVARYQAFGNVIWSLTKEQWKVDDPEYWASRVALIRELDAYRHLLTTHDVELEGADFMADQHHQSFHDHILHQRAKRPWPVMNVEYGYEPGPIPTYGRITLPDEMRCRTWEILTAGGYPVYYYADTAWDVIDLAPLPEGYLAFRVIREVMERLPYWEMEPSDHLVDQGLCLAKPRAAYLIYLPSGGRAHVDMVAAARGEPAIQARWVNPRTGQEVAAGPIRNGINSFMTPLAFGVGDSVLMAVADPAGK